jgi:hypothetical protein
VEDLRDLGGRLLRLLVATMVGVPGAFAIALGIDWLTRHDAHPMRDFELPLLFAGAIVCTFGCYVVLQALAHRRPRIRLPRARLVVR